MVTNAAQFQARVDKAVLNMDRFDKIVNGSVTTEVIVDDAVVPSLAKLQKTAFDAIGPAVAQAEAARDAVRPLFGSGAPAANLGNVGQVYYDTTNPDAVVFYGPKSATTGWGAGRALNGRAGKDAIAPMGYREVAAEGQTVFPSPVNNAATGQAGNADFSTVRRIAGDVGFSYAKETLVVYCDGFKLDPVGDYTANGGTASITLTKAAKVGQVYTFYTYVVATSDASSQGFAEANLLNFKVAGDLDDFAAVRRAYAAGFTRVYAPKGKGSLPGGVYSCKTGPFVGFKPGYNALNATGAEHYVTGKGNLVLFDGVTPMHGLILRGDGIDKTVWSQDGANYGLYFNAKSEDAANNLNGLTLEDMTFIGLGGNNVAQTGHIFQISGITGLRVRRVKFKGFSGDGLCFQPSPDPTEWSHNYDALVEDCVFDGVNKRNRNPVTLEDLTGGTFINNRIYNAVSEIDAEAVAIFDVEPRGPRYRVGHITIARNRARNFGGAFAAIYMSPADGYEVVLGGFRIVGNVMDDGKRIFDFAGPLTQDIMSAKARVDIEATGNKSRNCGDLRIQGIFGAHVHHNTFDLGDTLKIGDQGLGRGNRDVVVDHNTFSRFGKLDGITCLLDDTTVGCSLSYNLFSDCGVQANTTSAGYLVLARHGEIGTRMIDNQIDNVNGRLKAGFVRVDGDTSIGATARKSGNEVIRGPGFFTPDTINPALVRSGMTLDYTFVTALNAVAGGSFRFDISAPGVTDGTFWHVGWKGYLQDVVGVNNGSPAIIHWHAEPLQFQVLRLTAIVAGNSQTIPAGKTVTLVQL